MARPTTVRFTLTGTLTCLTPLHVGGHGAEPDTDLPLARDGRGRCYVPGTSLAGPLRHWCATAFAKTGVQVAEVWGFQHPTDSTKGTASHLTVDDLPVSESDLVPEVRDGVGIDRHTGAAATHIKYDRAVLPHGSELRSFTVTAEVPDRLENDALSILVALKDELEAGQVRLGAAKTRGLGRVKLTGATLRRRELDRDGILALLRDKVAPNVSPDDLNGVTQPKGQPRLDVVIAWAPDGPLMVKAGFDGIAADSLPLVSGRPGGVSPVLPGSSIKGAMRTRAEQIVCTLLDLDASSTIDPKKRSLENLSVPLVDELFGARGGVETPADPKVRRRGQYRHGTPDESTFGLGALTADDCYAATHIDRTKWQNVITAGEIKKDGKQVLSAEASLRAKLEDAGLMKWQQGFHVAIDRWTGGAAAGLLYSVLEPHATAWEPIRLSVDLNRTPTAGVALLLLVLRDMVAGRLPLGFAVNRGMGAVSVHAVTITPHHAPTLGTETFTLAALPAAVRSSLNADWKAWLANGPSTGVAG